MSTTGGRESSSPQPPGSARKGSKKPLNSIASSTATNSGLATPSESYAACLVRDPTHHGLKPRPLLTGFYGSHGERIRHIVHDGALQLPIDALEMIMEQMLPRDHVVAATRKYELPGLDSVIRPCADPSLGSIMVTELTNVIVPPPPQLQQPPQQQAGNEFMVVPPPPPLNALPTIQTVAVNRTLRLAKPTNVIETTERIRGGGGDEGTDDEQVPPDILATQQPTTTVPNIPMANDLGGDTNTQTVSAGQATHTSAASAPSRAASLPEMAPQTPDEDNTVGPLETPSVNVPDQAEASNGMVADATSTTPLVVSLPNANGILSSAAPMSIPAGSTIILAARSSTTTAPLTSEALPTIGAPSTTSAAPSSARTTTSADAVAPPATHAAPSTMTTSMTTPVLPPHSLASTAVDFSQSVSSASTPAVPMALPIAPLTEPRTPLPVAEAGWTTPAAVPSVPSTEPAVPSSVSSSFTSATPTILVAPPHASTEAQGTSTTTTATSTSTISPAPITPAIPKAAPPVTANAASAVASPTVTQTSQAPASSFPSVPKSLPAVSSDTTTVSTSAAAAASSAPKPLSAIDKLVHLSLVQPLPSKPESQWLQLVPEPNDEVVDPKTPRPDWYQSESASSFERTMLPEWFDGSAPHRTPQSYRQTRDRIIAMSDRLGNRNVTATLVRRSIVGDAGSLIRLHSFLNSWGLINEDAVNDTAPTGSGMRHEGSALTADKKHPLWDERRRDELMEAVVQEATRMKRPKLDLEVMDEDDAFIPIDWEAVAERVGYGASSFDCEREFLSMPIQESAKGGSTGERSITPDNTSSDRAATVKEVPSLATMRESIFQEIVEHSRPEVLRVVTEAALKATNGDLLEAQRAAIVGLVASQAADRARSEEDAMARILSELVDQRMHKIENRMALMDDIEGILEAERVCLELERRDLYTARCRHWFGGT